MLISLRRSITLVAVSYPERNLSQLLNTDLGFLLSNDRTDEYSGSFENRIRFLMEVTRAVRAATGDERRRGLGCEDSVVDAARSRPNYLATFRSCISLNNI
jgi:hypothetical protein